MKYRKVEFILAGLMLCAAAVPAFSQAKSKEEKKLEAGAAELDKKDPEGQRRVADKIKAEFKVDYERLVGLHFKGLRDGEIAVTLALAQSLHGGIRDENLHRIVALREGPPPAGWGKIAKDLGLKLGPVISKVRKISAEVSKQEKLDVAAEKKKAAAEKAEAAKKARAEKAEAARKAKAEKAEAAKKARAERLSKSKIVKEGVKAPARP